MHELVDAKTTADHSAIFNDHVASHLDRIGHHDAIAQFAVMAEMAIGHQEIAVADAGALPFVGGAVDRDALPNRIAIADDHLR